MAPSDAVSRVGLDRSPVSGHSDRRRPLERGRRDGVRRKSVGRGDRGNRRCDRGLGGWWCADRLGRAREQGHPRGRQVLPVRRYFTIPGRDPFDEIEWELRDAFIPGKDKPTFDQKGVEFPKFWSQTATNIVAQKYLRGRMILTRARAFDPPDDRPRRDDDRHLGPDGRLLRERGRGADLRGRGSRRSSSTRLAAFQLPGVVQRRLRGEAAVLGVLHPLGRGLDGLDPRLDPARRGDLPRRLGARARTSRGFAPRRNRLSKGGYASGQIVLHARGRCFRRDDQVRWQDAPCGEDGRARRRSSGHPRVRLVQGEGEEEGARVLEAAGYDMSLDSADWSSIQYQNANNSVRVSDSFMEAAAANADWNLTAHAPTARSSRRCRRASFSIRSPTPPGVARIQASSTTRRSTRGTRCRRSGADQRI